TEAPSWAHLMGTDQFGRDLFSRIIFGARTALIVGFSCAIVGGLAGLVLGVASAYFGGRLDLLLQRVFDVVMAFPLIIMALAVVAVFGSGVYNVVGAITIPLLPRCAPGGCSSRGGLGSGRGRISRRGALAASATRESSCATWCRTCWRRF